MKKVGFTLAEVLLTILIIGIIAAVTLPAVQKAQPDKLEAMRRKSYYILEQTVTQLYNDDLMYRKKADGSTPGLQNTEKIKLNGKTYEGRTKFCELYANSLNKRARTTTNCTPNAKTFTSADNVDWYMPVTDFSPGYAPVTFDVNGKAEPNCEYSAQCKKPDRFTYYVLSDGRILEKEPTINRATYCIKTNITGRGTVSPSPDYCGLTNGIYILKAVPQTNWRSNWPNNEKRIRIKDKDETTSVAFSESPQACIRLTVNCETGLPNTCGSYGITGSTFTQSGNILTACNLYANDYTISVTPLSTHSASWLSQTIALNGIDQALSVDLVEATYCLTLNVTCPGGGANVCGTYTMTGGGNTYGLDASGNTARTCALKKGSYTLTVTPKPGYRTDTTTKNFQIAADTTGTVIFQKTVKNCRDDGYFEAGGKKWSCPFMPTAINDVECGQMRAQGKVDYCYSVSDYWAGAVKQCGGKDKMPSPQDLASIASVLYQGSPSIGATANKSGLTYIPGTANSLGLAELQGSYVGYSFWSNMESSDTTTASTREYSATNTKWSSAFRWNAVEAICRVD